MKIVVCVKIIPASKMDKNNGEDAYKIGRYDLYALKTAIAVKEKYNLSIDVICMAPLHCCDCLKKLYIYDINKIYLANDPLFAGADTFVTSLVLQKMIEKIGGAQIVLCGKCSEDSSTSQVGPSLAQRLNYPLISNISSILLEGAYIKCESSTEDSLYEVVSQLPIVGTVHVPPVNHKYPSLKNVLYSKKEIAVLNAKQLTLSRSQTKSNTKVLRLFSYENEKNGTFIQGSHSAQVTKFMEIIKLYN